MRGRTTGRGCDRLGEGGLVWGWGILRAVGNVLPTKKYATERIKEGMRKERETY